MNLLKEKHKKRIAIILLVSVIILSIFTSFKLYLSYYSINKASQITIAKQYISIAENIANGLDKEKYEQYLRTQQYDDNRESIKEYLENNRHSINALIVYTLLLDDSDVAKAMVAAPPSNVPELPIGFPCTVPTKQVNYAKNGLPYSTDILVDETYGVYLSVGVPFYNDSGKLLGVLGIDIDVSELDSISQQVMSSNKVFFILDVLFIIALLLVTFMLHKWYKSNLKRELHESERMYISELGKVMSSIKSSRHDLMNHLQVLHGLMELKLYDKAADYLKQMKFDSKTLDLSLRIKNPVLLILLQSKWEHAQTKNIEIHFETDPDEYLRIESMDLVKILSNLLDNAIDAVEFYSGEHPKRIRVTCKTIGTKYIFAVENPSILSAKEQKNIFQYGYTTKENTNSLRGNGLMIVKRTVEKYRGDMHFQYSNEKVLIQITL